MFGWFRKKRKIEEVDTTKETKSETKKETSKSHTKTTLCPYCGNDFKRVVKAKSKCKACGKTVYKRTSISGESIVVTEEEKEKIDKEYEVRRVISCDIETLNSNYAAHRGYALAAIRKELKERFGKEPLASDIAWYILNQESVRTLSDTYNIGSYQNVRLDMARVSYERGNYATALRLLFEVIYLDHCNMYKVVMLMHDPTLASVMPYTKGSVPPALVEMAYVLIDLSGTDEGEAEALYVEANRSLYAAYSPEISPKESFGELKQILYKEKTK